MDIQAIWPTAPRSIRHRCIVFGVVVILLTLGCSTQPATTTIPSYCCIQLREMHGGMWPPEIDSGYCLYWDSSMTSPSVCSFTDTVRVCLDVQLENLYALLRRLDSLGLWALNPGDASSNENIYRTHWRLLVETNEKSWSNPFNDGCVVDNPGRSRPTTEEITRFQTGLEAVLGFFVTAASSTQIDCPCASIVLNARTNQKSCLRIPKGIR